MRGTHQPLPARMADPPPDRMMINIGPQHPSTHGVLRVAAQIAGETIEKADCDIGYLHRGVEKLIESRLYYQGMVYTDRTDYTAAPANNLVT